MWQAGAEANPKWKPIHLHIRPDGLGPHGPDWIRQIEIAVKRDFRTCCLL